MPVLDFTPKGSGIHRRYERLKPSMVCGGIALIAVFVVLLLAWLWMPPLF